MNFNYSLFAVTTFISSFLLFQVQPLIGKHILPWYGGSSAVWITAMFFFMVALAVGYVYVLFISKLRPWYQAFIHLSIVVVTLVSMYLHAKVWPSSITPLVGDIQVYFADPVLAVFVTLLITIGLPFTLLSSTSSLLQMWYSSLSGKEPFTLYSISNIGSLLGLLSYPLFFEPFFTTFTQGQVWSYGLVAYAILLVSIIYILITRPVVTDGKSESLNTEDENSTKPSYKKFAIWLGVASVPVMVLLAGTSFMTTSIAPVPFLWIGPLALYLLSFILSFRSGERTPFWFNEVCVVLSVMLSLILVVFSVANVFITILAIHFTLFAIFHWCHEYLYILRPNPKHLTLFYVALSLGGILGSLVIKLSSQYILTLPIELTIILILSLIFISYRWFLAQSLYLPVLNQTKLRLVTALILIAVIGAGTAHIYKQQRKVVAQERNFFGYKAIVIDYRNDFEILSMQHGQTNHGYQIKKNGELIVLPVSYYSFTSGIGRAFSYLRSQSTDGLKVAVAGLGTGGLSAYCESNDEFTFLEIDKDVVTLALENCPQNKVIVADARLTFEQIAREGNNKYDLIILDAYADDMMPVHLMTTEAVALYKKLLKPDGVLTIHISSRYLNLLPVTKALAEDNELYSRHLFDNVINSETAVASNWVLFANSDKVFENEAFSEMSSFTAKDKTILWTDSYSALLPIIRFR